jgi:hypothetical protein
VDRSEEDSDGSQLDRCDPLKGYRRPLLPPSESDLEDRDSLPRELPDELELDEPELPLPDDRGLDEETVLRGAEDDTSRGDDDSLVELLLGAGAAAGFDSVLELEVELEVELELRTLLEFVLVPIGTRSRATGADSVSLRTGREIVVVVPADPELPTGRAFAGGV